MKLQVSLPETSGWLSGNGPENAVIISSRIRVARNLAGFPFPGKANGNTQEKTYETVINAVRHTALLKNTKTYRLDEMTKLERHLLMERHLISHEHAESKGVAGLIVDANETISIMINEEDHLRLAAMESGLALETAWERLNHIDDELGQTLNYASHARWGFLTACPTNCGTGLRASCLTHLVALAITNELPIILETLTRLGIATRGLYGEGTKAMGNIFQLSNATTLGRPESEIINHLTQVLKRIIRHEHEAREKIMSPEARTKTEDKIFRSYGILKTARMLSFEESVLHLSLVALGIQVGLDIPVEIAGVNKLMFITQPAHVQVTAGNELGADERDKVRAAIIRKIFNK